MIHPKTGYAFILIGALLALACWIYWPGSAGPSLLDDRSSLFKIIDSEVEPEHAWDYILGDRSGLLGRSVSMSTFVLEKLVFDGDIHTSKKVNIVLHLFIGALVCWLYALLLRNIGVPSSAILAIALGSWWLLAPQHVSTVLYAVQRMAMMSTLFMLLACVSYCYWRESLSRGVSNVFAGAAVPVFVILGLFSKENAIVSIPIILLIEALWFQFKDDRREVIPWLRTAVLVLITLGAIGLLLTLTLGYDGLASKFSRRPFTMEERVLTQTRVLWDYVAQFYWPDLSRLGIYHDDFRISRSLFDPITTLYASVAWAGSLVVAIGLLRWKWGKYLTFALAWFLLGHAVESTVLPLELYFEHRNYFSSFGLVLFFGVLIGAVTTRFPQLRAPLAVYLILMAFWLALQTSSQVQIWSSRVLLSFNHYNGHPASYRATTDMATLMASLGDYELARRYSAEAYEISRGEVVGDLDLRELALSCIADRAVPPQSIRDLGDENSRRPFSSSSNFILLVRLLQEDRCPSLDRLLLADRLKTIYLAEGAVSQAKPAIYMSLAVLENALQRFDPANAYIEKYLQRYPREARALLMKLHFTTALNEREQRENVLTRLQLLDQQGKLTVREQQTLSLYLENQP